MLLYRLLADLILFIHAAMVAFVIFGLLLTLLGMLLRWKWVRNFWFRTVHLALIGFIVVQTWLGQHCPLTNWENAMRQRAGEASYPGGCITYWVNRCLFYEAEQWIFNIIYSLFGLAVLVTFLIAPPRWPWRKQSTLK